MSSIISYQAEKDCAVITIDDGKANAVSPKFLEEAHSALDQAEKDGKVVVLTGRPGKFSAGFDLSIVKQGGQAKANLFRSGAELALRLLDFPTPIIIACNGHALAMGAVLLLTVDYRVGTEGNYKIGLNEVAIGITFPRYVVEIARARLSSVHLNRSVGIAEIHTPQDAIVSGFLDRIVPEDKLMETAISSASALAKLDMTAHFQTKLMVREDTIRAIKAAIEKDFDQ